MGDCSLKKKDMPESGRWEDCAGTGSGRNDQQAVLKKKGKQTKDESGPGRAVRGSRQTALELKGGLSVKSGKGGTTRNHSGL